MSQTQKKELTKYFLLLDIKINDKPIKAYSINDRRFIRNILIKRYKIGNKLSEAKVKLFKEKYAKPFTETLTFNNIFNLINREEFFKFDHKRYLKFKNVYLNVRYDKENSTEEKPIIVSDGEFKFKVDIKLKEQKKSETKEEPKKSEQSEKKEEVKEEKNDYKSKRKNNKK